MSNIRTTWRAINHQKSLVRCVPYLWKSEAQLITGNLTPLFLYQHQLHFEQSQMTLGHKTSHPRWIEQKARNGWTICHTQIHFQCVPKYRWGHNLRAPFNIALTWPGHLWNHHKIDDNNLMDRPSEETDNEGTFSITREQQLWVQLLAGHFRMNWCHLPEVIKLSLIDSDSN